MYRLRFTKNALSPALLGALVISICMVFYVSLTPPRIIVPEQIAYEWDSIWFKNIPTPCTSNNSIWCADSKEFLGCVLAKRSLGAWVVIKWTPATNMKRLPLAVSGECNAPYNGWWHIHPAVVDPDSETHLLFFRSLSGADLETLLESSAKISIITWAPTHLTAAIKWRNRVVYPVPITVGR